MKKKKQPTPMRKRTNANNECFTHQRQQDRMLHPPMLSFESEQFAKNDTSSFMAFKGRQWNKAVNYYSEAIKINGTNATYYCNRAAAYLELGCFQQAEEDCSKAISLDKAYLRRGMAKETLLRYNEALQDFKHALVLEPQNKVANLAEKRLRKLIS